MILLPGRNRRIASIRQGLANGFGMRGGFAVVGETGETLHIHRRNVRVSLGRVSMICLRGWHAVVFAQVVFVDVLAAL